MDDRTLRLLSQKLGVGWESLATYLDISADRVTLIKIDFRSEGTEEQIFQMLSMWKNDFDVELYACGMEIELRKALILHGRRDLANEIEQGTLSSEVEPSARREQIDRLTDKILRELAGGLGRGWEQLATHLGLSSTQVGTLKRDYYGVGEQIFQMLIKWKAESNDDRPLDVLYDALRKIGRNDLAADFKEMIEVSQ